MTAGGSGDVNVDVDEMMQGVLNHILQIQRERGRG